MLNKYLGIREISYAAPQLSPSSSPLEIDALMAPGDGEWRVFVFPGSPANKLLYTRFLSTAPRDIEVIVITRPGFGKDHPEPVISFDEQIAAMKPFLPASEGGGEFGDKKIITMGVSYGGELALKAALTFPEAVRGVVTVAALIDEPHDYALQLEKLGGAPGFEEWVPDRWRKVRAEIAGRRDQIGPLLEDLKNLTAPVEVIHGDFDALVPISNAHSLMDALRPQGRAALEIIPGGTHYLELQYPRRLHQAIERVIERSERLATVEQNDEQSERTGAHG